MAHMHITSWVLAIILIILVSMFYKQEKMKPGKILHMILRLDYLFILYTGITLYFTHYYPNAGGYGPEVILKMIAGLWAVISMEMIAVKLSHKEPIKGFVIQLIIAVVIAIILGFGRLPFGILP